jgi:hypothetical protein
MTQTAISAQFGIDHTNVSMIIHRRTWRHVP